MKLYFVLILTAISMAFVTGYVAFFVQGEHSATSEDVIEINQIKQSFQKYVSPQSIVNFNSLYFNKEQFKLLNPVYLLAENGLQANMNVYSGDQKCFENMEALMSKGTIDKPFLWEQFRCKRRRSLPRDFFVESPFLHPSGHSYAYLAYKRGLGGHDHPLWVQNHLPFFHALELKEVKRELGKLYGVFSILEKLNETELAQIAKGKGTVLTTDFLFARLTYPKLFSILEYRIYSRADLDNFLKGSPYVLSAHEAGTHCFFLDGTLCWNYNVRHIVRITNKGTLSLFLGLVIIIILVVRLLLVKIKNQRMEDEKRRLALRVLTHEFRTPITSMLLLMERWNLKMDTLDDDLQEIYLRLSSEVHRLKRLTETSRNYLKAEQNKKLLELNYELIADLNIFVDECLIPFEEAYPEQIIFIPSTSPIEILIDSYWLQICLKNIIDNAVTHGKAPIQVKVEEKGQKIEIIVTDEGIIDFEELEVMTEEFIKGNKSTGTGLGMNIVKKVIKEMGGELKLARNPTTISLVLPNKRTHNGQDTDS